MSESAQTFPVAVVADVHLGNHQLFGGSTVGGMNRRCRLGLDTFKRAVQEAQRHGAQTFIVAGDLYDTVLPPPQLLAATIDVFNQMQESVYLVPGNHDAASSLEDDHALGPLGRAPGVYVVNRTMLAEYTALCVPYAPGRATEWLDDGIRKHCAPSWPSRTLITHVGVADANTHPELRKAHDAVEASWLLFEMETHGLHRAVVGNWHNHAVWTSPTSDTTIIQAGALVPTGFDNPGLTDYGSLILLDPMSGAWKREVIPGPRFLKLGPEDVPDLEACVAGAIAAHTIGTGMLFVDVRAAPEDLPGAMAELARLEVLYGLGGARARPDAKQVQASQRAAAQAAAQAIDPEAAIRAYVADMPVEGTVARDRVAERALAIWRGA